LLLGSGPGGLHCAHGLPLSPRNRSAADQMNVAWFFTVSDWAIATLRLL
jgi:hypothetical protein